MKCDSTCTLSRYSISIINQFRSKVFRLDSRVLRKSIVGTLLLMLNHGVSSSVTFYQLCNTIIVFKDHTLDNVLKKSCFIT